ncbi:MAG: hypothetical protein ACFFCV_20040 [Promethearchaeota archaeon]
MNKLTNKLLSRIDIKNQEIVLTFEDESKYKIYCKENFAIKKVGD